MSVARDRRPAAVNLGQGFPDTDGPREVLDAAIAAINGGAQPVPAGPWHGRAARGDRRAPAAVLRVWSTTPTREVLVTAGATEALAGALMALLDTGDEVVAVRADVRQLPGVHRDWPGRSPRRSRLRPPTLRSSTTTSSAPRSRRRRKLLLLNTPHNPTGQGVRAQSELQFIADLAIEHDLIVVTDEVYEHLVFDGTRTRRSRPCLACASARS